MDELDLTNKDNLPEFAAVEPAVSVATTSDLSSLHGTLVKALMNRLKSGRASAAEFSVIAKFLADNNITAALGNSEALDALKKKLEAKRNATRGGIPRDLIAAAELAFDKGMKQ